jgi:arylsulfatase A
MIEESRNMALRAGNWKYVDPTQHKVHGKRVLRSESLFNLDEDPSEQNNVASEYPEKTRQLKELLEGMKSN